MQVDLSLVIALVALLVSILSVYFQWFRVRGPVITLLNNDEEQRAVLRPYEGLPEVTRQLFPKYEEQYPGYAIIRLLFANSGDRAGFARITKVEVTDASVSSTPEAGAIKPSYYTHSMVPAYSLTTHDIIIRNIFPVDTSKELQLAARVEWGGPNPRNGQYEAQGTMECKLKVILEPSVFGVPLEHI
jgi:hypothetical protein